MIGYYAVKDGKGGRTEVFWLPEYFYSRGIHRNADYRWEHKWDYDSIDFMNRIFGDEDIKSVLEDSGWIIEKVEIHDKDANGILERSLDPEKPLNERNFNTWNWIDNILEYVLCNVDLNYSQDSFDWWERGENPFGDAWY